ncbi:MAG: hypothetical protein ACLU4N_26175 [Butyricimonas faecihominis]
MTPLFETDSLEWNELQTTDFVDDTVTLMLQWRCGEIADFCRLNLFGW